MYPDLDKHAGERSRQSGASRRTHLSAERQLRSLIESLPGVAFRCELQAPWRVQFISEAVADLTGYPADDFVAQGLAWESLIAPEDRTGVEQSVARAIREKSRYHIRYRIHRRDDEVRWVQERGGAVYSDEGDALFLEGFIGDIHEQTIAEGKLRESEELFRLASCATQDVIWDWDMVTDRVSWSAALADSLGYALAEPDTDLHWWLKRVHPADRERVSVELAAGIASESGRFVSEYRFLTAKGTYADILDRGYLIRDDAGAPVRMVGAMLDNSERLASHRALREREARLSTIFGQAMVGILHRSLTGELLMINERYCEILGRSEEEIRQLNPADYTHPEDLKWNQSQHYETVVRGSPMQIEKRYIRPDGSVVWCEVNISFVEAAEGQVGSVLVVAQDITARKESEMLHRSVLEASADCIMIVGLDGSLEFINGPGLRAIELDDPSEVMGMSWSALWPRPTCRKVESAIAAASNGRTKRFSGLCPTAKGNARWWDVLVSPMRDESGNVVRILAISRDITAQRQTSEQLKWASEHDALTSLPNRRAFEGHLQAATIRAMESGGEVGLLLLDLDYFKHVNDTLGHAAGDHLLTAVGERLQGILRGSDFVARLGGDEFAVILEGGNGPVDPQRVGETILAALSQPTEFEGRHISLGASIGSATFPKDADTALDLFKSADIALYSLKDGGRGGTRMFHKTMLDQAQLVASQLSLARVAISADSVEPHYQQKVDLRTGAIAGFEALLRWRHSDGLQLPDSVSEAFKDYELASKIGDLMQGAVFRDVRTWLDRNLPVGFVAINAAPAEFLRDDFAERLIAKIREYEIPAALIEVEVTEHVFLHRGSDYVARALELLHRTGVRIALDDFGTGHSSLSHLRDFSVDVVKIDRSFVDQMTSDVEVKSIVAAVVNLAQSLGIDVVAEGVEREQQKRTLLKLGCRLGQGYYYGRPASGSEIPHLLRQGKVLRVA